MSEIRWPKTWLGWKRLIWLSLHRCPIHWTRLHIDSTIHDMGGPGYCFKCDGIAMWPRSARDALEQNYKAEMAKEEQ